MKFTLKTTWADFLTHKGLNAEGFDALEVAKQDEMHNEFNVEMAKVREEAIEAKASKEELAALKNEIEASLQRQFDNLNKAVKNMASKRVDSVQKSFKETLKEKLNANIDNLKALKAGGSAMNNVVIKAAGDMLISGNVTGQVPQAYRLPGLNAVPVRVPSLLNTVMGGTISSNLVEWVYQSGKDGAAGQTAEGATKNQIDFDLVVGSQKVEKTTAYITITDEMLGDPDFMATAINDELSRELLKAVESQVFSGSGVSPQMNGIYTVATAFSAPTGLAGAVDNANNVDVLIAAITQVRLAEQSEPNAIWMHPTDIAVLETTKVDATDRRYVAKLTNVAGSLNLNGINIYPSTLVTQGTFLVGDFTKAYVLTKDDLTIEIGYNADNFVKNYKTIRAEWRGVTYVKHNDRTAFVKGTFATAAAALETT